jgi:hypothetical protein
MAGTFILAAANFIFHLPPPAENGRSAGLSKIKPVISPGISPFGIWGAGARLPREAFFSARSVPGVMGSNTWFKQGLKIGKER